MEVCETALCHHTHTYLSNMTLQIQIISYDNEQLTNKMFC